MLAHYHTTDAQLNKQIAYQIPKYKNARTYVIQFVVCPIQCMNTYFHYATV